MTETKVTLVKRIFAYGKGSVAVVVPAQLGFKAGDMIRITFESIEHNKEVKE